MRVSNIQTHNNIGFKELRFKNAYMRNLSTMPEKILSKIDSIKDKLADTKYYHLDIDSSEYYISHQDGEKFYLPIMVNKAGKALIIKFRQGLTQISKKLKYNTTQEVNQLNERIRNSSTQIERTAEIVKILDEYESKLQK